MADWKTGYPRNLGSNRYINDDVSDIITETDPYLVPVATNIGLAAAVTAPGTQVVASGATDVILWTGATVAGGVSTAADQPMFTNAAGTLTLKAGFAGKFKISLFVDVGMNPATTEFGVALQVGAVSFSLGSYLNNTAGNQKSVCAVVLADLNDGALVSATLSSATNSSSPAPTSQLIIERISDQ